MENQKQQKSNTPQPQSLPQPSDTAYVISSQSKKVLQPSAELVREVKAEVAERAATEAARVIGLAKSQPGITTDAPQTQNKRSTLSESIYPEATAGFGTKAPSPEPIPDPVTEQLGSTSGNKNQILAVRIVAGILMLLELSSLYNWYLEYRAGYPSVADAIWICITLILLIGITRLIELARIIYVVIAVIGLIFFSIIIVQLYTHKQIVFQPTVNSEVISRERQNLETELKQNIPSLSAKQNQVDHEAEQKQLNSISGSTTDLDIKRNFSEVLGIIEAIGPLVFLTRPSIKKVFH